MLFAIVISLLGIVIGVRTSHYLVARNFFERSELTKFGTLYFALVIFLVIYLPRGHVSLWIAVFVPLTVIAIGLALAVKKRAARFRSSIREVLAMIALKMKSGRSFRQSMSEVISESAPSLRTKLSEIASAVVFSQQNNVNGADLFIVALTSELILIDRQPHSAARRLAVLREKLRVEDDFRRRSGQVLARIRAQSFVMTGLYVALAVFMAWKFGWRAHLRMFVTSGVLFCVGLICMLRGGRNLKWKV